MSDKLTKKQFIKRKTNLLMFQLCATLLDEETAKTLTMDNVRQQFPKRSYYKEQETGVIRVGLSFRGVKLLVKKYPLIQVNDVKRYFNLA